jgi:hypothetical protein
MIPYTFFHDAGTLSQEFEESIYPLVGSITVVIVFFVPVFYYLVLNRNTAMLHRLKHWLIFLVLCTIAIFLISYWMIDSMYQGNGFGSYGSDNSSTDNSVMWDFCIKNTILFMIIFFIVSLILKRFSIHAKKTPF